MKTACLKIDLQLKMSQSRNNFLDIEGGREGMCYMRTMKWENHQKLKTFTQSTFCDSLMTLFCKSSFSKEPVFFNTSVTKLPPRKTEPFDSVIVRDEFSNFTFTAILTITSSFAH